MKYTAVLALLIMIASCSQNELSTSGLKSVLEQKTSVKFKPGDKTDSTEVLYYTLSEKDLAAGHGRFDSTKSACISYFNDPGVYHEIGGKAVFTWHKKDFYTLLVSGYDKDSNVVFHITTSTKPILPGE